MSARGVGRVVGALLLTAGSAWGQGPTPSRPNPKVLIEFGWDEPDTAFLRHRVADMAKTPFDGCVFHAVARSGDGKTVDDFAWKSWGTRAFRREELAGAFADLKAMPVTRFRHNLLRFNTTPADLDWFDDHAAVVANARLAAELARAGRCRGVVLDTEQYQGPLFRYPKQRDAATKPYAAYAERARGVGREVMAAFQEGYPGLTVMLTFGPSYVRLKTEGGKTPVESAEYGLLIPFAAGLAEGRKGDATLIDGHEPSYGYRDTARFDAAVANIKAADPRLGVGFGLWLDYDHPKYGWDVEHPGRNYFTPERFESSLRAALERSEGVVWVYGETPRWWSKEGGSVKLPGAYVEAIRRARRGLTAD